jgi:hypothetical protein
MPTLYKLDIHGIVYLVDPATLDAYLYDLTNPTKIGHVIWENPKDKPSLTLLPNWQDILKQKCDSGNIHP